jgi:LPS-assembly protein
VQFDPSTGLDEKLSDYVGRIDVAPTDWLDLRYRFRLDKNDLTYVRNELGVSVTRPRVRFDLGYLMLEDDPALQSLREREEIRGGISVRVSDSLSLRATNRYDLAADRTVSWQLGLIYTHPCLQLAAGIQRRNTSNRDAEDTTTISFRIVFRNLGGIGTEANLFGAGG